MALKTRRLRNIKCKYCDTQFQTRRKGQIFCSYPCGTKASKYGHISKQPKYQERACKNCNITYMPKAVTKTALYCSPVCRQRFYRGICQSPTERNCQGCGESFRPVRQRKAKYCSQLCRGRSYDRSKRLLKCKLLQCSITKTKLQMEGFYPFCTAVCRDSYNDLRVIKKSEKIKKDNLKRDTRAKKLDQIDGFYEKRWQRLCDLSKVVPGLKRIVDQIEKESIQV